MRRQHGVVARAQVMAMGSSLASYDGLVQRGRLVAQEWGVHRSADVRPGARGIAMAAVLRAGPRACVAGPLALRWMGVDSVSADAGFAVLLPEDVKRPRLWSPVPVWQTSVPPRVVLVDGIPCCHPARNLVECTRILDREAWLGLVDQAGWRQRPRQQDVVREVATLPPTSPAVSRAARWLEAAGKGEESPGERRMFAALAPDLEARFVRQVAITPRVRVDGWDPGSGVSLDYLGKDHHHAGNRPFDAARHDALRDAGAHPVYVWSEDLASPEALTRRVRRAIARAEQHHLAPR